MKVLTFVQRPRLKRSVETLSMPSGDVRILCVATSEDVIVESPTEEERALLSTLDGSLDVSALEARFGTGKVTNFLDALGAEQLLEDAADDDLIPSAERERFDRQLRCFGDFGGASPSEAQARLRDAKVAVLGVGGLGGWAAQALACHGVGEMWLVDGDRIEPSNLNRQILYTPADLGRLKVEVAAARLHAFNPLARVTATPRRLENQSELAEFIAGADVVVDTADWPAFEFERWCNAACFQAGIPYMSMSHFSSLARVGPFFVPGRTGCFSCQEIALRRTWPLLDLVMEKLQLNPKEAATLGAACGLIGSQVALDLVYYLTGLVEPATLGASMTYDLRTMETQREEIASEPGCPVCSSLGDKRPKAVGSIAV